MAGVAAFTRSARHRDDAGITIPTAAASTHTVKHSPHRERDGERERDREREGG